MVQHAAHGYVPPCDQNFRVVVRVLVPAWPASPHSPAHQLASAVRGVEQQLIVRSNDNDSPLLGATADPGWFCQ